MARDNSERIREIEEILQAGAEMVAVDGTTVRYNFRELRAELRRLQQSDDNQRRRRPTFLSIDLGGN